MSTITDQYLVDYDEIKDRMIELANTAFPPVEAHVFDSARPGDDPDRKSFTTSAQFSALAAVGAVVVLPQDAYHRIGANRWRCLRPGQHCTWYLMTQDLVAVLLRSNPRGIVIVLPATTD